MTIIKYMTTIGIDLGTTYSCVGAWINGVEIIAKRQEIEQHLLMLHLQIPERVIGDGAKNQAAMNQKYYI